MLSDEPLISGKDSLWLNLVSAATFLGGAAVITYIGLETILSAHTSSIAKSDSILGVFGVFVCGPVIGSIGLAALLASYHQIINRFYKTTTQE